MSRDEKLIVLVGGVGSDTYIVSRQLARALQIQYVGEMNEHGSGMPGALEQTMSRGLAFRRQR